MKPWEAVRRFFADRNDLHTITRSNWETGDDPTWESWSGMDVTQAGALKLAVVWRCVRLISETLAALPADAVRAVGNVRQPVPRSPAWLQAPNPATSWFEFSERIFESLLMDGNAFVLITVRDATQHAAELWTLHPRDVDVRTDRGPVPYYVWGGSRQLSRYSPQNPGGELLHVRLATAGGARGLSPIDAARQSIGLGLVGEKSAAKFFGKGAQLPGVIQMPPANSPALAREYTSLMRDTWKEHHSGSDKAWEVPGILSGGSTWVNVAATPEQAQFIQSRAFQVEEIASRIFGVPPHMVGLTEKQTSYGTGVEQQALGFVRFTLLPWIVRFESAMSQLLPLGQFLRLNQRGLIRADSKTEAEVLNGQLQNGVIDWEEYRALLDLTPRQGDKRRMIPANMQLLDPNGEPVKQPPPATPEAAPTPNGNGRVSVPVGGE